MVNNYFTIIIFLLVVIVMSTIVTYQKFGIKRVLLGKKHDSRELIYYNENGIDWKPTLRSWKIIVTGGMDTLTIFLLILIITLSFIYSHDMTATRLNDDKLCKAFGRVLDVSEEDIINYNNNNPQINITIKPK